MQEMDSETVASPSTITVDLSAVHEVVDTAVECRVALTGRRQQVLTSETETGHRAHDLQGSENANGSDGVVRDRVNGKEGMGCSSADLKDVGNEQQSLLYMKSVNNYISLLTLGICVVKESREVYSVARDRGVCLLGNAASVF